MSRFILAPAAVVDLAEIWRYIRDRGSEPAADRVEQALRRQFAALASAPGSGHTRKDLTSQPVKFFAIYSYLIVYSAEAKPIRIVAILHGNRDLERRLGERL